MQPVIIGVALVNCPSCCPQQDKPNLGFKKKDQFKQEGVAHLGAQPEPSWPFPAGAEVAGPSKTSQLLGRDLAGQPALWLSPLHTKSTASLELMSFLSPTDVPWRDLTPPTHTRESVRSFS